MNALALRARTFRSAIMVGESKAMRKNEREIIRQFAAGEKRLRDQAISIFHMKLREGIRAQSTPEMRFMSEIDNPAPDLLLRSIRRRELLGEGS